MFLIGTLPEVTPICFYTHFEPLKNQKKKKKKEEEEKKEKNRRKFTLLTGVLLLRS
jgi:hypothetical protein